MSGSPYPLEGTGLPDYSALETVGLTPAQLAKANQLAGELTMLVEVHAGVAQQVQTDLAKLMSFATALEAINEQILPLVSALATKLGNVSGEGNAGAVAASLCKGPLGALLCNPQALSLGKTVIGQILQGLSKGIIG
jgi:hypothetical protein